MMGEKHFDCNATMPTTDKRSDDAGLVERHRHLDYLRAPFAPGVGSSGSLNRLKAYAKAVSGSLNGALTQLRTLSLNQWKNLQA